MKFNFFFIFFLFYPLTLNIICFVEKNKLEHIRWRAIANPHALEEI